MSSYLVMLAIKILKTNYKNSIRNAIRIFYLDKNLMFQNLNYVSLFQKMFNYLEQEIEKLSLGIYRQFRCVTFCMRKWRIRLLQFFARFCGGFHRVYDRNYINVNAHELAHQWFGDLITASENIIGCKKVLPYYALLAERHLFGDDYFL